MQETLAETPRPGNSGLPDASLEARLAAAENQLRCLLDREAIREVLFRYCRAADRCDAELMKSCYHDDAIDDHGFFSGPASAFCDYVVEALSQLELSVHSLSNILVEIDGDRAFVESGYSVIHRISHILGFTDFSHQGRYLDVFERRGCTWKISRRIICQDGERWLQTANLNGLTRGKPNAPVFGHQNLSDPSYLRFEIGSLIRNRPRMNDIWSGFRRLSLIPVWLVRLFTVLVGTFVDSGHTIKTRGQHD